MASLASLAPTLEGRLESLKNPDGGWPYYAGKTSRLEPTCWALLALQAAGKRVSPDVLSTWPRRDGWFVDKSSDAVNVAFNGLAGVTLRAVGAAESDLTPLRHALIGMKGQKLGQSPALRQDNSLQAWPWVDGTFSWTEPTAWAMLFLKRLGSGEAATAARLAEGEQLLFDRMCVNGGWNFGNPHVLGADLDAYVPTTAMCLIALRNRRDVAPVKKSADFLRSHRLAERSAMALGLTTIALHLHDRAEPDVDVALGAAMAHTAFLSNAHLTAISLYATAGRAKAYEALRV